MPWTISRPRLVTMCSSFYKDLQANNTHELQKGNVLQYLLQNAVLSNQTQTHLHKGNNLVEENKITSKDVYTPS